MTPTTTIRCLAAITCAVVVSFSSSLRAADFEPSGPGVLPRLLGPDAFDDVDRSDIARGVEKQGFWAGDPIGISQCASCHADAAAQWSGSAHRFASFNNPYYTAAVEAFRKERGFVASRFCAGCHDPALVSSGRIDGPIDRRTREAQAGIVCLTCHSIADHPPRTGNGQFVAKLMPWSTKGPEHKARLRPTVMGTADFCGTCHRVGLTEDVTHGRWLRGQDDLYPFLGSSIAGNGAAAVHRAPQQQQNCQGCHMQPEVAMLGDAAAKPGTDGVLRIASHRFLGANTALPHLRGDRQQQARTEAFLRDRVSIDLQLAEGGELDVILRSKGVGHRFPSGTMDSNEVWIEVRALDDKGAVVGQSGVLRTSGGVATLDKEAHLVRAQMVDANGKPLLTRDVQHARGVVYDNALNPGDPQAIRYELPKSARRAEARLLYRKFSADYARFACAEIPDAELRKRCEDPPIVEMAKANLAVPALRSTVEAQCRTLPSEQVLDHGLALAAALVDRAEEARAWLSCAAAREPKRVEPQLGLARLALVLGQTDEVLDRAARALALNPLHPAPHYLATLALLRAYRPALSEAELLVKALPTDPSALTLLAKARGLAGDPGGALEATTRLLAIDPDSEEGHYQRSLALKELHRDDEAILEEKLYLARRVSAEENLALRAGFRRWHAQLHDESEPLHTHALHAESASAVGTAANEVPRTH